MMKISVSMLHLSDICILLNSQGHDVVVVASGSRDALVKVTEAGRNVLRNARFPWSFA